MHTGERTGRSPLDRFVVEEGWSKKNVWWGPVNKPASPELFNKLLSRAVDHL
nr:phosphoenolpyruvate carboxykinase (ATP) [bacterium]